MPHHAIRLIEANHVLRRELIAYVWAKQNKNI